MTDGAYDTYAFYKIIGEKWQERALIPSTKTSKSQDELKKPPQQPFSYLKQPDAVIKEIRQSAPFEERLTCWKKDSGWHQRSRIEAFMSRLKRIFGFYWHNPTTSGRINEMIIKMNLLNQMSALGKAEYDP